jgi:hypothetical protein
MTERGRAHRQKQSSQDPAILRLDAWRADQPRRKTQRLLRQLLAANTHVVMGRVSWSLTNSITERWSRKKLSLWSPAVHYTSFISSDALKAPL